MVTPRVFPDPFPPACATAWGDDRYGLWCEITVKGVVQRLRWIEPGTFWMGSTKEERESFAAGDKDWLDQVTDESPRHLVRLTEGFWLADTACTQALWQGVTGDNPSTFRGDSNLPVEQVSWGDVTMKFLSALTQQLSEAEVLLPTESQWEYACRAGTKTAYHFGESSTTDQVNISGKHKIPVKTLPANRWGMYQMHGNVWEWCADAIRSYLDGGRELSDRVLRGGCWHSDARSARCASRNIEHRNHHNDAIGFRFVLKPAL